MLNFVLLTVIRKKLNTDDSSGSLAIFSVRNLLMTLVAGSTFDASSVQAMGVTNEKGNVFDDFVSAISDQIEGEDPDPDALPKQPGLDILLPTKHALGLHPTRRPTSSCSCLHSSLLCPGDAVVRLRELCLVQQSCHLIINAASNAVVEDVYTKFTNEWTNRTVSTPVLTIRAASHHRKHTSLCLSFSISALIQVVETSYWKDRISKVQVHEVSSSTRAARLDYNTELRAI